MALKLIPRGTKILQESPLCTINDYEESAKKKSSKNTKKKSNAITAQVAALTPDDRARFNALSPANPDIDAIARFGRNSYETPLNGTKRLGIFIEASRFNHSCIPNAVSHWEPRLYRKNVQGCLTLRAMQDIAMDTEILVSYISSSNLDSKADRQAELSGDSPWQFDCDCPPCSAEGVVRSDSIRVQIRAYSEEFYDEPRLTEPRNKVERRRDLMEIEHLLDLLRIERIIYPDLANAYGLLVQWCIREMGEVEPPRVKTLKDCYDTGLQAARKKLDIEVACSGGRSEYVVDTLDLMSRLRYEGQGSE